MEDKTLTCRDCGREFVFTVGEQEFFAQKGFTNDPSRCPECRSARKARRADGGELETRRTREMYSAVCAQCGQPTQVPFQPRSDRPVYCSECYSSRRGSGDYERRTSAGARGGGRSRW